jgi:hypothetical protein
MQVKTKLVLKTIVPVSVVLGFLQFLFASVIPKQLDMPMPVAVLVTTNMAFMTGNGFIVVFLAIRLAAKADAANSDESGDTD